MDFPDWYEPEEQSAWSIFLGLRSEKAGTVKYHGKEINFKTPKEAVKEGFGLVPEDRKLLGNFPDQGVRFNSTIVIKDKFLNAGRYNARYEHEMTAKYIDTMKTKVSSMEQLISKLSGGNQQKVLNQSLADGNEGCSDYG